MTDLNPKIIPIKNIYYLLAYAWEVLDISGVKNTEDESFENYYDLMASLLITGINWLIKKGLRYQYRGNIEELSILKGKIIFSDSIKSQSYIRKRMVCEFDEFNHNNTFNQIIKSTIFSLFKSAELNKDLKKKLYILYYRFDQVDLIELKKHSFAKIIFNQSNRHYKFLLNICQFVFERKISNDQNGQLTIESFTRDQSLAKLYEKFILNFYRRHLNQNQYLIHSPQVNWDLNLTQLSEESQQFLPKMQTDIAIKNQASNKTLVIDAKFYKETVSHGQFGEKPTIHSGNLYQIYTYVNNYLAQGSSVDGLLLYPTTDRELNLALPFQNQSKIYAQTINLGGDWTDIYNRLISISTLC